GDPWRPLKFRLDDEAHTCRPSSLSGFMARHIEHPASRNSNPASVKTRSSPSATSLSRTAWDPGTTIAFTCGATLYPPPLRALATTWKSEYRPLVHDPMKATSMCVPETAWPGLNPMNS